jgi:hypothetical protein
VAFLARVSAFDAVMDVIGLFDNGRTATSAAKSRDVVWSKPAKTTAPTAHVVDAFHESFTSVDPSGRDAENLCSSEATKTR